MGLGSVVVENFLEVVLPTYNGVLYLEDQLASIFGQRLCPDQVLIRDDGSSDGTQELIQKLKKCYGDWLKVLPGGENLGCTANVNRLLEVSTARYVALADQDDVWLPNKLEVALQAIYSIENGNNGIVPSLVHTDLHLTDAWLKPYGCTYIRQQRINPKANRPSDIALTNIATGCTILLNKKLISIALPIPKEALVHDWWLALVASAHGCIQFIPEASILYRQHQQNTIGAKRIGFSYWLERLVQFVTNPSSGGHTYAAVLQMDCFESRYGFSVSGMPRLVRVKRAQRMLKLLKMGFSGLPHKHGPLRTIALYIWLFRVRRIAK